MTQFQIGDWRVSPALNELRRGDEPVRVEPRSIEVLCFLAERPGEVLSKEEIIRGVWREAFVTDEVLTHAIWDLRRALDDDARQPTYIQTISKRGYRLVAPVERLGDGGAHGAGPEGWLPRAGFAVAAAAVLVALLLVFRPTDRTSVSGAPRALAPGSQCLVLEPPDDALIEAIPELTPRRLERRLSQLQAISVVFDAGQCGRSDPADHALELDLPAQPGGPPEAAFRSLVSGRTTYSVPLPRSGATQALVGRVRAFAAANALPQAHDPHFRAWFDWSRHQPEAIAAFLEGLLYTLRFVSGGEEEYRRAIALDDDYAAPRIFLAVTLLGKNPDALAEQVAGLERLKGTGSSFENRMIQWAIALGSNDPAAIAHLEAAHKVKPNDGPVAIVLATIRARTRQLDVALDALQPLIDSRWAYPGLYPQAAGYSMELGDFERAAQTLALGLDHAPSVTLDSWALLEVLAVRDGDLAAADGYRDRLVALVDELSPDDRHLAVESSLRAVAESARRSGDDDLARRIEELLAFFSGVGPGPRTDQGPSSG